MSHNLKLQQTVCFKFNEEEHLQKFSSCVSFKSLNYKQDETQALGV